MEPAAAVWAVIDMSPRPSAVLRGGRGVHDGSGDLGGCIQLGEVGGAGDGGRIAVGAQGGEALAVGGSEVGVVLSERHPYGRREAGQLVGSLGGGEHGGDEIGVEL
jgi:hypothetical protein